jgi:hypothetical protein
MDKKLSSKRKLKNDIVLAVVIILLATAGLLLFNLFKTEGSFVSVKIDGVEKYRYSLEENIDIVIYTGENNEYENRLVIKDSKAVIVQANCPDKICVGHRAVNKVNESIVCLPHKLVIEITASASAGEPDVVV